MRKKWSCSPTRTMVDGGSITGAAHRRSANKHKYIEAVAAAAVQLSSGEMKTKAKRGKKK